MVQGLRGCRHCGLHILHETLKHILFCRTVSEAVR